MFKKILSLTVGISTLLGAALPSAMADLPIRAYGKDTVAGFATELSTSLLNPNQSLTFLVEKADGSVIRIPAEADLEGIAAADLFGHQTKVAGRYTVSATFPGSDEVSPSSAFMVFADEVSETQSLITVTEEIVDADGNEKTFATVTLYDAYRNPISDHQVKLISSRGEDDITPLADGKTDTDGRANFKITSKFPGISTLTAFDLTAGKVLTDRNEVVFMAPAKEESITSLLGANLFKADIGQGQIDVIPGPVDRFEITDLPSTVKVSDELTMTVRAVDTDGNTAKNYTGSILISIPEDENAVLPSNGEYTFKASDQGEFTFNLALQFSKLGNQVVQIFDKNDFKISGEHNLEVVPEQAVVTSPTSDDLEIKTPGDGAELANSSVVITGKGDAFINLKVFDNDTKIGDTETDGDGFFTYQAQGLSSGPHTLYVMSDQGEVSKSITVNIDTIAPVVNQFEITPDGTLLPGDRVTITAESEPNLSEAKVRIQGVEEVLIESIPGTYEGTFSVPNTAGTFPVDLILIDALSNKTEKLNQGSLLVQTQAAVSPAQVTGVNAASADSEVTLVWNAVTHNTAIDKYRVYYGAAFDNLSDFLEADGNRTTATITDLNNDVQYFFAVTAVDVNGLESAVRSTTLAVTPEAPVVATPTPINTQQLQAVSQNGGVTLSWTPFAGARAFFYKVYFGTAEGQYSDFIVTANNATTVNVNDLINGLPYHFAVVALDINGQEISNFSNNVAVIPGGEGIYASAPDSPLVTIPTPTAPVFTGDFNNNILDQQLSNLPQTDETGPEAIWVLIISLVFAHFFYHHKKKVLS